MPEAETLDRDKEEKVDVFTKPVRRKETERPIYLFMIVPIAVTAIFSILFCLFPKIFFIYDLAQVAVQNIFGGIQP